VVEDVAVEEPVLVCVGFELDRRRRHRRDVDGVLERRALPLPVEHPEEMPVEVHRVMHHRPVRHFEAHAFALPDSDRILRPKDLTVHAPDVALHVAREIQRHDACRSRTLDGRVAGGAQLHVRG
jgi:hypothetical protein